MTELEAHLLEAFKRLDNQYQLRDQQLTRAVGELTKRLNDGAGRIEILSAQVTALAGRIERLQTILSKR